MKTKQLILLLIIFLNISAVLAESQSCSVHNHTKRLTLMKSSFSKYLISHTELERGYSFKFTKSNKSRLVINSFVKSETKCCNFLKLKVFEENNELILTIKGNNQAKLFIGNILIKNF